MAKLGIEFDGFEQLIQKLEDVESRSETAVENALIETNKYVTKNLKKEISHHRLTGVTESSLKTNTDVIWQGTVAETDVGFNISEGGLPSIFLMYGTPTMEPDKGLYNAIYGRKTKNKIAEIQEQEFRKCMTG